MGHWTPPLPSERGLPDGGPLVLCRCTHQSHHWPQLDLSFCEEGAERRLAGLLSLLQKSPKALLHRLLWKLLEAVALSPTLSTTGSLALCPLPTHSPLYKPVRSAGVGLSLVSPGVKGQLPRPHFQFLSQQQCLSQGQHGENMQNTGIWQCRLEGCDVDGGVRLWSGLLVGDEEMVGRKSLGTSRPGDCLSNLALWPAGGTGAPETMGFLAFNQPCFQSPSSSPALCRPWAGVMCTAPHCAP
jgi:hypothetical protein